MVRRIINLFQSEFAGLHQAAYLLGIFALLSQILALFRDRLLAHFFGASSTLDVYYAAFRIPDFIYISIASFVSVSVLIPFLVDKIKDVGTDDNEPARFFLNNIFSFFFLTIIFVSTIVFFITPFLSQFVVPGFSDGEKEMFVELTRLLLLSPILLGVSSLLGSVTQTYRRFFVYASAPILYNVGIIAGIIFLLPSFGIHGVVYGVLLGAFLHLIIQLPTVRYQGLMPKLSLRIAFREIKDVLLLSFPRTIALSFHHITLLILVALASFMVEGSIAIFQFSFNLQSVPLSIIGVSYSVAAFPTLSRLFSGGNMNSFAQYVEGAARHIIFWSLPAIVLFVVLRAQIVRTVLGSGEFSWTDTRLTAAALALFSVSLLAQSLQLLFIKGYYATGQTKRPLIITGFTAVFIVALSFMLLRAFEEFPFFAYFVESLLRIEGLSGSVVIMLPLSFAIGSIVGGILFLFYFNKDVIKISSSLGRAFMHAFSASIIMGFAAYQSLVLLGSLLDINTFWGIFLQGLVSGVFGIIVGFIVLKMLKNRELKEIEKNIHKRLWGTQAVAPDREEL